MELAVNDRVLVMQQGKILDIARVNFVHKPCCGRIVGVTSLWRSLRKFYVVGEVPSEGCAWHFGTEDTASHEFVADPTEPALTIELVK